MARRTQASKTPIVRPPLTPDDAARLAGTYVKPRRADFLRRTVDVIDRADLEGVAAVDRLRRFVQDWQHHAKASAFVELGEALAFLVDAVGKDTEEEETVGEAKIKVVDDILAKVPGFDNLDDINPDHLVDAFSLLDALAEEYEVEPSWQGYPKLRERLVDNRVKEDDASGTLDALKADRDELARELEAVKAENCALRGDLKGLLNHVGTLHGEAVKVAEARFGAKPAA
jgi:hypothetical protein